MAEFLGWEKASSALLLLGFVSSQHRRLAGTGWRHRQVDNPELKHQQGTVSIFHTLCSIKAFLCPEYLQTDVSTTPEPCRLFWLCSWREQAPPRQLNTTGSSQEPVQGRDAAAAQHPCKTPSPPPAHPASCEVPPQGSSWMAAAGQGMGSRRAHRSWCHHPHGPWPQTRSSGPLGKHRPALQCDPNSATHIWAPLERASLQGKPDVQG